MFGTIWAFCNLIQCKADEKFTKTVVEGEWGILPSWVVVKCKCEKEVGDGNQ